MLSHRCEHHQSRRFLQKGVPHTYPMSRLPTDPPLCPVHTFQEWIMEKWEEGYYITGMAGSMTGSSLVVMSKGTPYTQQSYKVWTSVGQRVWGVG